MHIVLVLYFVIILRKCCRGGFFHQQLGHLPTLQRCDSYGLILVLYEKDNFSLKLFLEKKIISVYI
jgi:hypothetical protein